MQRKLKCICRKCDIEVFTQSCILTYTLYVNFPQCKTHEFVQDDSDFHKHYRTEIDYYAKT